MLASFALAACAGKQVSSRPDPAFLAELKRNAGKRQAVSGNLMLTSTLEGRTISTPAVLLAEFPDRLRLEVQTPVGGVLALLVLNGDRFWYYENEAKEILTGPVKLLPYPLLQGLSADLAVRVFLARPGLGDVSDFALGDGSVSWKREGAENTLLWDEPLAEPGEWRISGKEGAVARYRDYEFKSGLRYPTRIELEGKTPRGQPQKVTLAWKDWEPTVPKSKKLFQIPQQETFGRKIKVLR